MPKTAMPNKAIYSAILATLGALTAPLALSQAAFKVDVPSQDLADALRVVGRQTSTNIIFEPSIVKGIRVAQVRDELTADQAINKLLEGTKLTAKRTSTDTIVVQKRSPAAPSTSKATEPAATDAKGDQKPSFWDRFRLAQVDQESPVNDTQSSAQGTPVQLEEVVVTATRRPENLQSVPLSIAVVTEDDIDRRGLVNSEDYLRSIPGVSQTEGFPGQAITIRGLETTRDLQNYGSGTTVATYFGETPTTNSAGLGGGSNIDLKVVDIARVEVLRGPQGTSFGDSSMGGAVRTIPAAPQLEEFVGKVTVGYSQTAGAGGDNYTVQAVGNFPLIQDRFAVRLVGYRDEDSGYYRNRAASDPTFLSKAVTPYGAQAFAVDNNEVGSHSVSGGRGAALLQVTDDLRFTATFVKQKTEIDGPPVATAGGYDQTTLQVAPEHVIRGQTGGASDTNIDLLNAMVEYKLGWGDLLASYSDIDSGALEAYQYTYVNSFFPASYRADSAHREHIGEVRLVTQLDGAWNFTAGVYYQKVKDTEVNNYLWYGDPAKNFFPSGAGQRFLGEFFDRRSLEQKAAYGEVSWQILAPLTLTGGIRTYKYERTFDYDANGTPFFGAAGIHVAADTDVSRTTARASLSYKISNDALVYAAWSEGFRLGQLQRGVPSGTCDVNGDGVIDGTGITVDSTRKISSDTVQSYEIGTKLALFDRRLTTSADVFYMNWSDMPVRAIASCNGITQSYTANAGASKSQGVEFEANWRVTDTLRLDVGGAFIDAELTQALGVPLNAPSGSRLPSPKVNANVGLQYRLPVGINSLFLRTDAIYVGRFYSTVSELPETDAGDYVRVDLSARAEIHNLNVTVFMNNLTNEDAFTYRYSSNLGPLWGARLQPRTVGLRIGYEF